MLNKDGAYLPGLNVSSCSSHFDKTLYDFLLVVVSCDLCYNV